MEVFFLIEGRFHGERFAIDVGTNANFDQGLACFIDEDFEMMGFRDRCGDANSVGSLFESPIFC